MSRTQTKAEKVDKDLPFHKRLSVRFLVTLAISFLIGAVIIWGVSFRQLEQKNHRLQKELQRLSARESVNRGIPPDKVHSAVHKLLREYTWNTLTVALVVLLGLLGIRYWLLKRWVLNPVKYIIEQNKPGDRNLPSVIDEDQIPDNEIGKLMRSRNNMLNALRTLFSEEAEETLIRAVDAKDNYTRGHSQRVAQLAKLLAKKLGYDNALQSRVKKSGLLHDLGKIGVPRTILIKEDSLTEEEYRLVKTHPEKGADIIQFSGFEDEVIDGIRHHHERWDGNGYPDGLSREDIPLFGRILAVADAIDAMLSNRAYRPPLEIEEVCNELSEHQGTQFDPEIADTALELLEEDHLDSLPNELQRRIDDLKGD